MFVDVSYDIEYTIVDSGELQQLFEERRVSDARSSELVLPSLGHCYFYPRSAKAFAWGFSGRKTPEKSRLWCSNSFALTTCSAALCVFFMASTKLNKPSLSPAMVTAW